MKISFHGVKNATGIWSCNGGSYRSIEDGIIPEEKYNTLHVVATNENGKDLDRIKPVLKAFPNRINSSALDFTVDEFYNGSYSDTKKVYGINEDIVNLNRASLPLLEKIQKFLERVGNMDAQENVIEDRFDTSKEAIYAFRRHCARGGEQEFKETLKEAARVPSSGTSMANYFSRVLKKDIEHFKLNQKHMDEYVQKYFE